MNERNNSVVDDAQYSLILTNTEVLQYIVQRLKDSSDTYGKKIQKELFEEICSPLEYGADFTKEQNKYKNRISSVFKDKKDNFKKSYGKNFNELTKEIPCSRRERKKREEVFKFIQNSMNQYLLRDIKKLVNKIPCQQDNPTRYKVLKEKALKPILYIFSYSDIFDKVKFDKLVDSSSCSDKAEILDFIQESMKFYVENEIKDILTQIPCKKDVKKSKSQASDISIKKILSIFKYMNGFNHTKFINLIEEIFCKENERDRKLKILDFLKKKLKTYSISIPENLEELVDQLLCKRCDSSTTDYSSSFNLWLSKKNGKPFKNLIQNNQVKENLQRNFNFSPKLWSDDAQSQKKTLDICVSDYLNEKKRRYFHDDIDSAGELTDDEKDQMLLIRGMNDKEIKKYLKKNKKNISRLFFEKMIPIMYDKMYHKLLVKIVEVYLSLAYILNRTNVLLSYAHSLGSSTICRFDEAVLVLEHVAKIIDEKDKIKIIDMRTEIISNRLRYASITKNDNKGIKEAIEDFFIQYEELFMTSDEYYYYPGINLAYKMKLKNVLFDFDGSVKDIYTKSKRSINKDKESSNHITRYWASITELEFGLLQESPNALQSLDMFLADTKEDFIPIDGLVRTKRQMQFFIDTIIDFSKEKEPQNIECVVLMEKAVKTIDNFIIAKDEMDM